jgi:REP element-mobilizing transposase RayT
MPQSYVNLIYHIVFSTKDREPMITDQFQARLYAYLGGIIREQGGIALEINGLADHVHILAKVRQDKAVSDAIRDIKANSSGWVHDEFSRHFAWQRGYGAFTVSASQGERVRQYIRRQKEHHRKQPFKEEFIALLKAHEIEFDERYLWD